jgi:hypothetical protein
MFHLVRTLSFISILDRIRTEIVLWEHLIVSPFADWVFHANNDGPHLLRQTAAMICAIGTGDLEREFTESVDQSNAWAQKVYGSAFRRDSRLWHRFVPILRHEGYRF